MPCRRRVLKKAVSKGKEFGGATGRLLVFFERPGNTTSCATIDLRDMGDVSVHAYSDDPDQLAAVLRYIHDKYPELEVELIDPRNFFYFWYVAKHRIKGGKATWIYNGRKVFEGVPSLDEVDSLLSPELG